MWNGHITGGQRIVQVWNERWWWRSDSEEEEEEEVSEKYLGSVQYVYKKTIVFDSIRLKGLADCC